MNENDRIAIIRGVIGIRELESESKHPADRERWKEVADNLYVVWQKSCVEHARKGNRK